MDISLDHPGNHLYVREIADDRIIVGTMALTRSFLLAPDSLVKDWPTTDVTTLETTHGDAILALQPELVLLGSGIRQAFPPVSFTAHLLQRGIGLEVMDNAAAARTYGLIASEGRRVVAAFILPGVA